VPRLCQRLGHVISLESHGRTVSRCTSRLPEHASACLLSAQGSGRERSAEGVDVGRGPHVRHDDGPRRRS
jgi:hypothetical protein